MWNAGFDEIRFSEERYDSFSDAPQASSADAFGTQGVDIWAVKPTGPRRGRTPSTKREDTPDDAHPSLATLPEPDERYDAGSLGCGDGPLTQIAATLKRMPPGSVLEVRSTDRGVATDLPAWCRMVGHHFLGEGRDADSGRYFIKRKED